MCRRLPESILFLNLNDAAALLSDCLPNRIPLYLIFKTTAFHARFYITDIILRIIKHVEEIGIVLPPRH